MVARTCRVDDENSCPAGFDVWVPETYAHAEAVVAAVDNNQRFHLLKT